LGFRQLSYESAFVIMGATIMGSAALSIFINLKGHRSLLWGKDDVADANKGVLVVPEKDDEAPEKNDEAPEEVNA
jgi:NNP family nitrate/nitrite transporter-like MFS transporter